MNKTDSAVLKRSRDAALPADSTHRVRMLKLDVPTFDGDILNWVTFWELFAVVVHDRSHLSNARLPQTFA